jgi:hypothetical protein
MTNDPKQVQRMSSIVQTGLVFVGALLLLAGCAPAERDGSEESSAAPQTIRQVDRPLLPAAGDATGRVFDGGFARGTLDDDGSWRLRGEITHSRLRCGRYRLGVRFGSGDASCTKVDWRTQLLTTPERRQCNAATLIHTGGGTLDLRADARRALNCARVVLRCAGACG